MPIPPDLLAQVLDNGKAVSITFPPSIFPMFFNTESSIFHAEWLWFNRGGNILPGAGQRITSSGSYYNNRPRKISISKATFYLRHELNDPLEASMSHSRPDSAHPVDLQESTKERKNISNISSSSMEILLLEIVWNSMDLDQGIEKSYYPLNWLERWRYDSLALRRLRSRAEVTPFNTFIHKWNSGLYHDRNQQYMGLLDFDYRDIMRDSLEQNEHQLFQLMETIVLDGAVILRNVPVGEADAPVTNMAKLLGGYLSHGNLYGETFQVRSEPHAINVAYTSQPLASHQDLAYYESKPGLQLLHCIETFPGDMGGESTLIDGLAAAYRFRQISPKHFRTLTQCNASFVKERQGAHMTFCRPHIVLKSDDEMSHDYREIVAVHWAPPFEGPLLISPDNVRPYYEAYASFELMVDDTKRSIDGSQMSEELSLHSKDFTWQYRLKPGEMLIFNNARMLHGRRGFQTNELGSRLLIGGYTNMEDTLNHFRLMLKDRAMGYYYPNVGNGTTSFIP